MRNALFHNGETRADWRVQIDTPRLLTKNPTTKERTINRRLFHDAVLAEFRRYCAELLSGPAEVRTRFLQRLDAICGWPIIPLPYAYFVYGSNLLESEIKKDAHEALNLGRAYIPGSRLVFNKHSKKWHGDAANIVEDSAGMVWGWVYNVSGADRTRLQSREGGYKDTDDIFALLKPTADDTPTPIKVFTFIAEQVCSQACSPASSYLEAIIRGATERGLPDDYIRWLGDLART